MRAYVPSAASLRALAVTLAGLALAALAGRYIALRGLSYREILVALAALVGAGMALAGDRGVRIGFIVWVYTLGLGYRTVEVTPYLRLHPAEALLWALAGLLVVRQGVLRHEPLTWGLPRWLWLFMPFWLWAWWPGLIAGRPWDLMFAEFRDFALLLPLFFVASAMLTPGERQQEPAPFASGAAPLFVEKTPRHPDQAWRAVILAFYGVSAWIAAMGVLEYFVPGVRSLLPGFVGNPAPTRSAEGFLRAEFSFWGATAAVFICTLAVPLTMTVWGWAARPWQRALTLVALALQVLAIYIAGYRSMWLLLGLTWVAAVWLRRGPLIAGLSILPALLGYRFLPAATQDRVLSLIVALEGRPTDTSAAKRWNLATSAFDYAQQQPLGHGWAGSGWTHSDFVQVIANLGVAAGVLFIGAYLLTLWRLWRHVRRAAPGDQRLQLSVGLFLSFIVVGGILLMEGVQVLPQLVLPVWFVWVLAELWLRSAPKAHAT